MIPPTRTAAERWATTLAGWAVPRSILAAAPDSPWELPPRLFEPRVTSVDPDDRSRAVALAALDAIALEVGAR